MTFQSWILLISACAIVGGALGWPRIGLIALARRSRDHHRRCLFEDALKYLHACEWRGQPSSWEGLAGTLRLSGQPLTALLDQMAAHGWVRWAEEGWRLCPEGERLALQVIRAHRLWERYLADEARMPLGQIHARAERLEHRRSPEAMLALASALGHPDTDPHGDPIPTADGRLARQKLTRITQWPPHEPAVIVHIEDEPAPVFAQILAQGLLPGRRLLVLELDDLRLVLSDGEETMTLARVVADNIFVAAAPALAARASRLSTLARGRRAVIAGLDPSLQGFTRRRLLDFGLTPGTPVEAELSSLFGDPLAYRVRGTLVALRRDQARHVLIELEPAAKESAA